MKCDHVFGHRALFSSLPHYYLFTNESRLEAEIEESKAALKRQTETNQQLERTIHSQTISRVEYEALVRRVDHLRAKVAEEIRVSCAILQ